jgi:hypothetical protein
MKRTIRGYVFLLCIYYAPLVNAQPAPCTAKDGKGIVACVAAAYPEKLVAKVTLAQRTENMQFVRDRIIETARCATLNVGLNLKRGGPSISNDFIAWKNGTRLEGVDIASAYDDVSIPLKLQWHTYGPPNYGFPTYKEYGPVNCVIAPVPPVVVPPAPPEPPPPAVDLGPILRQIEALQKQVADLLQRVAVQETTLFNLNEQVIRLNTTVVEIGSRKIPSGCSVQFLRCRLE